MAKRDGERVPWFKLYVDYSSTPSHDDLDDRALWTGVALMILIRAGCDARDDRQPWALLESGAPCSLNAIARRARQHHQVAQRGLLLLQAAGTVAQREDGAWGMPKFWEKQQTIAERDAAKGKERALARKVYFAVDGDLVKIGCSSNPWARMASLRESKATISLRAYIDGSFDLERSLHERFAEYRIAGEWYRYDGELRSYVDALPVATRSGTTTERGEGRGERSSLRSDPPPTPPVEGSAGLVLVSDDSPPRRGARKRPAAKPDERAAAVLDRVDFHRVRLGLAAMSGSARTAKTVTSRLREGATLEQALAVVDAFGRLADREPDKRTLLNATTPFTGASSERGGGWAWGLRLLDEERSKGPTRVASTEMPEWLRDA